MTTDDTPEVLDRLWAEIPTRDAPVGELLRAGRAVRRRRRTVVGAAAAAVVLVVGLGLVLLPHARDDGGSEVVDAPARELRARVFLDPPPEVQDVVTDLARWWPSQEGRAHAGWDPATHRLVYVSAPEFSSSCLPEAVAEVTADGPVSLRFEGDLPDVGRLCTADTAGVVVVVDGLAGAPDQLTVGSGTDARTLPVQVVDEPVGTLRGRLVTVGGPAPGSARRLSSGTVTFTGESDGAVLAASVGEDGGFSALLPPGVYRVTGASSEVHRGTGGCATLAPVRVRAGATVSADVVCPIR